MEAADAQDNLNYLALYSFITKPNASKLATVD
jgi:hypothetical protein